MIQSTNCYVLNDIFILLMIFYSILITMLIFYSILMSVMYIVERTKLHCKNTLRETSDILNTSDIPQISDIPDISDIPEISDINDYITWEKVLQMIRDIPEIFYHYKIIEYEIIKDINNNVMEFHKKETFTECLNNFGFNLEYKSAPYSLEIIINHCLNEKYNLRMVLERDDGKQIKFKI